MGINGILNMEIDLNLFIKIQQDEYNLKDNLKRYIENKYHQVADFRLKEYKGMLKEIRELMKQEQLEEILKRAWNKKREHEKKYNEYTNSTETIGYVNQRCYFEDREVEDENYKMLVEEIYGYIVDPDREIDLDYIEKLEKDFNKSCERVEKWIALMS